MTRSSLLSFGLVALIALSGCSAVEAQRYPTQRGSGDVYRPADHRNDRYDRRDDVRRYQQRVRQDVREYVRFLDRELRLGDRQEVRISEIIENRATRYLTEGRYRRAYPFPRDLHRGNQDRDVAAFWRDVDSRISRIMDRSQSREYRDITDGRSRHGYRGDRYDRNDRYEDDRREDRRRGRDRD